MKKETPQKMTPEQMAEKALGANDLIRKKVEIPEWDMTIWVKSMTVGEREAFGDDFVKGKDKHMREWLVVYTAQTEDGKPIFKGSQVKALREKSAKAVERIVDVADELNGIIDKKKLVKNSDNTQNENSSSD